MNIAALKIFCDVVRCRNFSEAARLRGCTQSAVSQIVAQMEKQMQVQLVDRSTRPLQPTPLGQCYYDGCKALVGKYDELADRYEELEAGIRNSHVEIGGTVTVAAIYSVGLSDMGQSVERFRAELPHAEVHIDYLHPDRVYERVLDGSADLGLVSFPKKTAELAVVRWRDEEMVLACAPQHALARRASLPLRELDGARYVHFDRNLVVRRRVDRFLHEHKAAVEVVAEFDNIENIKQAVSINAGVALLPAPTVRREVDAGTLSAVPLAGCRFTRPLAILHRRGQRLGAAAKRFMDLLLAAETAARSKAAAPGRNGAPRAPAKRRGRS